jgi:cell division septation protein DedD
VRNELERMERDRAKLLPKPIPQALPPMPDPNMMEEAPRPSPSKAPPGSGASLAPIHGIVNPNNTQGPMRTPIGSAGEKIESVPIPQSTDSFNTHPTTEQAPTERGGVVTPAKPAYALSFTPFKAPASLAPTAELVGRQAAGKPSRQYAVQVAALAEKKDAEGLAQLLRKIGYDAFVMTIQADRKTWHRVRVGQLAEYKAANELKKTLAGGSQFKDAYVIAK